MTFARAAPKFKKINGFNIKYQSIVCLQLFGVYAGIIFKGVCLESG